MAEFDPDRFFYQALPICVWASSSPALGSTVEIHQVGSLILSPRQKTTQQLRISDGNIYMYLYIIRLALVTWSKKQGGIQWSVTSPRIYLTFLSGWKWACEDNGLWSKECIDTSPAVPTFIKDVAIHLLPPENLEGLIVKHRLTTCSLSGVRPKKRHFHHPAVAQSPWWVGVSHTRAVHRHLYFSPDEPFK